MHGFSQQLGLGVQNDGARKHVLWRHDASDRRIRAGTLRERQLFRVGSALFEVRIMRAGRSDSRVRQQRLHDGTTLLPSTPQLLW